MKQAIEVALLVIDALVLINLLEVIRHLPIAD